MSFAQPAVPAESELSLFEALLLKGGFDVREWGTRRRLGRSRTIRSLVLFACLYPLIMIGAQVVVLLVTRLPLSLLVTTEYLTWALPLMIAFPPLMYFGAKFSWDMSEERYRLEKRKLGERPTPLFNDKLHD